MTYIVKTGSKANFIALQKSLRSTLAKDRLEVDYTADDQLIMARGGSVFSREVNTALYISPGLPVPGSNRLENATLKQVEDVHGEFLATIIFQDAEI